MTYEYLCDACGHEWEAEQSISAAPLKRCPKCRKQKARRQVSGGTGFLLKGGGWYADGYGSNRSSGASAGSSSASSSSESSDSSAKKSEGSSAKKSEGSSSKSSGASKSDSAA